MTTARSDQRWAGTARPHGASAVAAAVATLVLTGAAAGCGGPARSAPTSTRPVPTTVPTTTTTTLPSAVPTTVPTPPVATPGWSPVATVLPPAGGITSLDCLSDVLCVAAGGGVNHADAADAAGAGVTLSWDGAGWSPPSVWFPAPADGPVAAPARPAVACASGPLCVIADGTDHTSFGDGTTWARPTPLAAAPSAPAPGDPGPGRAGGRTAAVACTPGRFCALVDNLGHVAVLRGGSWSTPRSLTTPPGGAGVPGAAMVQTGRPGMACVSASSCTAAVGTAVATWDGARWTTAPSPFGAAGATGDTAVACPGADRCLIVHGTSVSVGSGGSWSTPRFIDGYGSLDAISCPTVDFCLAADAGGAVVTLAGGSWSSPRRVVPYPSGYRADGTSASCPTAQFCMVITGDGDYATYQGPGPLTPPTTTPPAAPPPAA